MFEAQTELLGGNAAGAQEKLDVAKQALTRYTELLQPFAPEVATEIGMGGVGAGLRPAPTPPLHRRSGVCGSAGQHVGIGVEGWLCRHAEGD